MLRIALPKGSLEEGTFKLFEEAGLPILRADDRSYNLSIQDPRISEALLLRPQEIPKYVEDREFELGITGWDWIVERAAIVKEVSDLNFSKRGTGKVKIVLATYADNPVNDPLDIPEDSSRVVTEYLSITKRFFRKIGKGKISIRPSFGATEVKVPRLAEYLVDVTETGETLRKNNKKIIAVLMESSTKLITYQEAWDNPVKRKAIEEVLTLFQGAIAARGRVLLKMNVLASQLEALVSWLPSLRSPSISQLYPTEESEKWFSVETVVWKAQTNIIIPQAKELGAKDILEIDVTKVVR